MTTKKAAQGLMMWLALCSLTLALDAPLNCAAWPVDYDEVTGDYLFYCEECTTTNGVANCNDWWPQWAWYDSSFESWPEDCPVCTSSQLGYEVSARDRGLRCRLGACESLCSRVPESIKTSSGKCVFPRRGITNVSSHDIQVRSADGRQVISVRLFEAKVNPACAGQPGKERLIRCGFETERPVVATCRPFDGQQVDNSSFQLTVDYHGHKYVILTKTPMSQESLASVTD